MKVIEPSVELIPQVPAADLLRSLERFGRTCYKSESRISEDSAEEFVRRIVARGHGAVLEHGVISARFICDRGVSHELVRHRLSSYCQESTRYCNYSKQVFGNEITVIKPLFFAPGSAAWDTWYNGCLAAEKAYFDLLACGCTAQEARAVLPHSLKTEVVMTANITEWRYVTKLRTSQAAHPQMREIMIPLLDKLTEYAPALFQDIKEGLNR